MAIPIEGFSIIAQHERVAHLLENGSLKAPNATALTDTHIWRCGFMSETDAQKFLLSLEALGLNVTQGPDSDVVLANEFDQSVEPFCEWLRIGVWEKAVIAWKEGTEPNTVTAREGWDPKVGSGLEFHDQSTMQFLDFLRLEDSVEVFLNKKTGEEVYIGRTSTPVDALFTQASEMVRNHFVTAGQPPLQGNASDTVAKAASMLEKVLAEAPQWWNAQWFYGKSQVALGHYEIAYEAFQKAYAQEKQVEAILRELAGVCLELRKFDEAVEVAEAALALAPDNVELLGNLSLALLLAGRPEHARKAIDAATNVDPEDKVNQTIARVLTEFEEGQRALPTSLQDLMKPARAKKRRFFNFPWNK